VRLVNTRNFCDRMWADRFQDIPVAADTIAMWAYGWRSQLYPPRAALGPAPQVEFLETQANIKPRVQSPYYGGLTNEIPGHIRQPGERLRINGAD